MSTPTTALRKTLSPAETQGTPWEQRRHELNGSDDVQLRLVTVDEKITEQTHDTTHTTAMTTATHEEPVMDRRQQTQPGLNISMQTLVLLGSMVGLVGFLWQFVGSPLTSLRDDVHDIKANYVSKDTLNTAMLTLAKQSDVQSLSLAVNKQSTDIATLQAEKLTMQAQIAQLQAKQH